MPKMFDHRPPPEGQMFSLDFWARIGGMLVFGYVGWWFGQSISSFPPTEAEQTATQLFALSGAGIGLLITHHLVLDPLRDIQQRLRRTGLVEVFSLIIGGFLGALIGALLTFPLSQLPGIFGSYLPLIVTILTTYFGAVAILSHSQKTREWLQVIRSPKRRSRQDITTFGRACLIDTSAVIDGRILGVLRSGFLDSVIIVPQFVLNELQILADSSDDQKRIRGRRGLDLLNEMQKDDTITIDITTDEVPGVRGVDQKLVALAMQQGRALITNDKNLSQVAELQDIQVLNLNVLADAVRPPVFIGDTLSIEIREEGREREQGIGYLEDGTMVVVEDARENIGQDVWVIVNRVWVTERGRMIFGRLKGSAGVLRDGGRV